MSNPASRLPARPSQEQLRKQAKELLRAFKAGAASARQRFQAVNARFADPSQGDDVSLGDAQFVLAREYGFDSWAKLVRHIESLRPVEGLDQFERLANDLVSAFRSSDADALRRLSDHFGRSFTVEQLRERLQDYLITPGGPHDFGLADAQTTIARLYGFESWAKLVESVSRPPTDPRTAPLGLSSKPPFYKIDWKENRIEVRPPVSDKDWDTIFDVMKALEITGLNSAHLTDTALERLADLDHVTRLNLGGSKRLTDAGILHLARMPQLQELDLSGWNAPGADRGLEVLRHLPELRTFEICWAQQVTDAGAANLRFCDNLESVNLLGTRTGDGVINALSGKQKLHRLRTGRLVTDAGLPHLHDLPVFKVWHPVESKYDLMSFEADRNSLLIDGPFTDKGLATLAGLEGVVGLSFFWHSPAFTSAGLEALKHLPNLAFLGCQGENCDDEAMRQISAIPKLRMLMAQGTVASDAGFAALSQSQTIEYIWGRECPNLGSRGFAALATMPALRGLAVSCLNVDDTALSALPHFPALRQLMPMDVPDQGFRHVGQCTQLEDLWCMYCRDTGDVATGHIAGLSRLKRYYAGKTQITDRSLEILGRMSSLERIEFWEIAGITDAGLRFLAALPRLREVTLDAPNVTREGAAIFPAHVRVNYG